MTWIQSSVVVVIATVVAGLVAFAGGRGGVELVAGVPVVWLLAGLAFALNWLAFVPAFLRRTERFYDLVGSGTFITVVVTAFALAGHHDARAIVPTVLVLVWALRLGSFLVRRVHQDGGDGRFDEIKQSAPRFLIAWTLQALWVFLTLSATLTSITSTTRPDVDVAFVIGIVLWVTGFALEVIADAQKRAFRKDPSSRGRFIHTGLWAWSRHPNYFGEILLWTGLLVASSSTFVGLQWVAVVSPLFVALLLTKVSGIPLLETRADERWRDDAAYQRYKATTPVLIPRPPRP